MKHQSPDLQSSGKPFIRSPVTLVAAVLLCNLAGILGSFVTITGEGSWYATIQKPPFNPPGFLFAPVWTLLFILMGISLYLVWMEGASRKEVRIALVAFGVQLVLNVLWSFLFFGLQSPFLGFIEILILWMSIAITIFLFYRVQQTAAFLLIPYLAWVSFATLLTYTVWILNG
jgi:tryptophan-rich sensory protein